jgi:hypothetical protein
MLHRILNTAKSVDVKRDEFHTHDSFLLSIKEKSDQKVQEYDLRISKLRQQINALEMKIEDIQELQRPYKVNSEVIDYEFDMKAMAKKMINKHKDIILDINESGVFFVYGHYDSDDEADPYYEEHFCDTWTEVSERVGVYSSLNDIIEKQKKEKTNGSK